MSGHRPGSRRPPPPRLRASGTETITRSRTSDERGTRTYDLAGEFTIANVVVPVPGSDSPWPLSGTVTRHYVVTKTTPDGARVTLAGLTAGPPPGTPPRGRARRPARQRRALSPPPALPRRPARPLAPDADTLDACAQELMSIGCRYVLITGGHEPTPQLVNRLYGNMRLPESFEQERLPQRYHGSGCTLASACAATFAHGLDPVDAVRQALSYTWNALKHGYRPGTGQHVPDRLFWGRTQADGSDAQ